MVLTPSRRQLRRREAGWEGSPRRIPAPRYTNRVEGGAIWVSLLKKVKPVTVNRVVTYTRRAQGEIGRSYPGRSARVPVVLWCRRAGGPHREVRADRAEVSRGRSTGRDQVRGREGPNVE